MADEKETDTKEKRTVPAMVRSARGVADHAAAVLEMQWDKERKAFKDPITVSLALFTYAKLTAALLDEAEAKFNARSTAAEIRIEKLEQQIAAFESWRAEAEAQGAEMAAGLEEMMRTGDPMAKLKEMMEGRVDVVSAPPPVLEMAPNGETSTVVPIKSDKIDKKQPKPAEKNGGAA